MSSSFRGKRAAGCGCCASPRRMEAPCGRFGLSTSKGGRGSDTYRTSTTACSSWSAYDMRSNHE